MALFGKTEQSTAVAESPKPSMDRILTFSSLTESQYKDIKEKTKREFIEKGADFYANYTQEMTLLDFGSGVKLNSFITNALPDRQDLPDSVVNKLKEGVPFRGTEEEVNESRDKIRYFVEGFSRKALTVKDFKTYVNGFDALTDSGFIEDKGLQKELSTLPDEDRVRIVDEIQKRFEGFSPVKIMSEERVGVEPQNEKPEIQFGIKPETAPPITSGKQIPIVHNEPIPTSTSTEIPISTPTSTSTPETPIATPQNNSLVLPTIGPTTIETPTTAPSTSQGMQAPGSTLRPVPPDFN